MNAFAHVGNRVRINNLEHRSSHTLVTADKMSFAPSRKFGTNARSRRRNQRQRPRQAPKWPKNTKSVCLPKVRNPTRADDSLPDDFVETLFKTFDLRFWEMAIDVLEEDDEYARNEKAQTLMRAKKKWEKNRHYRRQLRMWRKYELAHGSYKHPPKYGLIFYKGKYVPCPLEPELFCRCAWMVFSSEDCSDQFSDESSCEL